MSVEGFSKNAFEHDQRGDDGQVVEGKRLVEKGEWHHYLSIPLWRA